MSRLPKFGIDRIREFARLRVEQSSVRAVAGDIGMSYSGLHSFLRGGQPYQQTRDKLTEWYRRSVRVEIPPPTNDEVDSAITVLAAYLQSGGHRKVSEKDFDSIIDRLRQASKA